MAKKVVKNKLSAYNRCVSAIVVHEPGQDRKVAALSEFAMCADIFIYKKANYMSNEIVFDKVNNVV